MMMYYCDECAKTRGFPITNKSEKPQQCEFCDRNIVKCNIGNYSTLVGLDRNPDIFKTDKGSIKVHQMLSLPIRLPITKIHTKDKKISLSDKCILTFPSTVKEDGITTILITNRESGEQLCVQL